MAREREDEGAKVYRLDEPMRHETLRYYTPCSCLHRWITVNTWEESGNYAVFSLLCPPFLFRHQITHVNKAEAAESPNCKGSTDPPSTAISRRTSKRKGRQNRKPRKQASQHHYCSLSWVPSLRAAWRSVAWRSGARRATRRRSPNDGKTGRRKDGVYLNLKNKTYFAEIQA